MRIRSIIVSTVHVQETHFQPWRAVAALSIHSVQLPFETTVRLALRRLNY